MIDPPLQRCPFIELQIGNRGKAGDQIHSTGPDDNGRDQFVMRSIDDWKLVIMRMALASILICGSSPIDTAQFIATIAYHDHEDESHYVAEHYYKSTPA